jgi:hypothetical protein
MGHAALKVVTDLYFTALKLLRVLYLLHSSMLNYHRSSSTEGTAEGDVNSRSSGLHPWEENPGTYCIGRQVHPIVLLDVVAKITIPVLIEVFSFYGIPYVITILAIHTYHSISSCFQRRTSALRAFISVHYENKATQFFHSETHLQTSR